MQILESIVTLIHESVTCVTCHMTGHVPYTSLVFNTSATPSHPPWHVPNQGGSGCHWGNRWDEARALQGVQCPGPESHGSNSRCIDASLAICGWDWKSTKRRRHMRPQRRNTLEILIIRLAVVWDFEHLQYDMSFLTSFVLRRENWHEVDINQHLLATAEAPTLGSNIPMLQVPRRASLGNILPCLGPSRFCRFFPVFFPAKKKTEDRPETEGNHVNSKAWYKIYLKWPWNDHSHRRPYGSCVPRTLKTVSGLSTENYIVMPRGIRSASKEVATTSPVTFWRKTSGGVLVCCHAPLIMMVSWSILGDLIFTHFHVQWSKDSQCGSATSKSGRCFPGFHSTLCQGHLVVGFGGKVSNFRNGDIWEPKIPSFAFSRINTCFCLWP